MARYAISREGISRLEELKTKLETSSRQIIQAQAELFACVTRQEAELGVYYRRILEMTAKVSRICKDYEESINHLTVKDIPSKIQKIEELLTMFAEYDDSGGNSADPEQKIKQRIR